MPIFSKKEIGRKREQLALAYLQDHGLQLIDQNYYCPFGEIDLIMLDRISPSGPLSSCSSGPALDFHTIHGPDVPRLHQESGPLGGNFEKDEIVFIEVRTRSSTLYGDAIDSIDHYKQQKLIQSATYYLQKNKLLDRFNCRFDVIGFSSHNIDWIKDAFS